MSMREFQGLVHNWLLACFGREIANDKIERNHRFLEEALELAQACDCTINEAHQLVEYVFNRPIGQKNQEVGGVIITLNALCEVQKLDLEACADMELMRISELKTMKKIRAKQATKPKHSPLPI